MESIEQEYYARKSKTAALVDFNPHTIQNKFLENFQSLLNSRKVDLILCLQILTIINHG